MGDDFDGWLLLIAGGWLTLQLAAFALLRGGWRRAAWVSAGTMALALSVAVLGVLGGSNLAPIWVVFALPLCLAWIVLLWFVRALCWAVSSARI
ncbi:MAG TPA: hypothetical protein VFP53_01910 [Sphingomicrobium sp.]|nr:hypothetical protein [Sphingomicrobium sp.]